MDCNHVVHTCLSLTSTGGLTRCFIIISVSISVTASISKLLTYFIIGIIIKLWEKSSTWSRLGFWRTVSSLCASCVSWETCIKHNTYNSVTARTCLENACQENLLWLAYPKDIKKSRGEGSWLGGLTVHFPPRENCLTYSLLLPTNQAGLVSWLFQKSDILYDCFYFRPGCIKWLVSVYSFFRLFWTSDARFFVIN